MHHCNLDGVSSGFGRDGIRGTAIKIILSFECLCYVCVGIVTEIVFLLPS